MFLEAGEEKSYEVLEYVTGVVQGNEGVNTFVEAT